MGKKRMRTREKSFEQQLSEAARRVAKWPAWKRAALNWLVVESGVPATKSEVKK